MSVLILSRKINVSVKAEKHDSWKIWPPRTWLSFIPLNFMIVFGFWVAKFNIVVKDTTGEIEKIQSTGWIPTLLFHNSKSSGHPWRDSDLLSSLVSTPWTQWPTQHPTFMTPQSSPGPWWWSCPCTRTWRYWTSAIVLILKECCSLLKGHEKPVGF